MDPLSVSTLPLAMLAQSWLKPGLVTPLFQPIVDIAGVRHRIVAVEALARGPRGSAMETPGALFAAARRAGAVTQLDRLCIAAALDAARALPEHLELFLNVHPTTLSQDVKFSAFLAASAANAGIAPTRITIEILEHARIDQSECRQLRASIHVLRGHGIRIAVDDVSGAPEDIRRALSLRPDFVKVDAHVVRGAQKDTPDARAAPGDRREGDACRRARDRGRRRGAARPRGRERRRYPPGAGLLAQPPRTGGNVQ